MVWYSRGHCAEASYTQENGCYICRNSKDQCVEASYTQAKSPLMHWYSRDQHVEASNTQATRGQKIWYSSKMHVDMKFKADWHAEASCTQAKTWSLIFKAVIVATFLSCSPASSSDSPIFWAATVVYCCSWYSITNFSYLKSIHIKPSQTNLVSEGCSAKPICLLTSQQWQEESIFIMEVMIFTIEVGYVTIRAAMEVKIYLMRRCLICWMTSLDMRKLMMIILFKRLLLHMGGIVWRQFHALSQFDQRILLLLYKGDIITKEESLDYLHTKKRGKWQQCSGLVYHHG